MYFMLLTDDSSDSVEVNEQEPQPLFEGSAINEQESEPLFEGSAISVMQAHILIFQFALKHHLTAKAFSELLLLLKVLAPSHLLPQSLYLLKSFFLKVIPDVTVVKHYYCRTCHKPHNIADGNQCSNSFCTCATFDSFIRIPLGPQIQEMMKGIYTYIKFTRLILHVRLSVILYFILDVCIWKALQERFKIPSSPNIRDIYDGKQYKKWNVFLKTPAHISLLLNTDGVAIFRSSKSSVWPVWIVINELPKHQR